MIKNTAALAASLLAIGLCSSPASALNTRSFISANGVDTNPCTRTAPCRTLQTAHNNTSAGGEINMLDPAGYSVVIITKAISIVNDGVGSAGVLVPSGATGITINAGASDKINLRGLIIEGAGAGNNGIVFNTGASLTVQNSVVRGLTGSGIQFAPTASSHLQVSDTSVGDNAGSAIFVFPSGAGTVTAVFSRVETYNSNNGIQLSGGFSTGVITATIMDSGAAKNSNLGFSVFSSSGQAPTTLTVSRSVAANNFTGVGAVGVGATIRISQLTVTGNNNGWGTQSSGVLLSGGDNTIEGNGAGETAPPTYNKK